MLSINQVFDEEFYLEFNPEAAEAVEQGEFLTGLDHFLAVGVDGGLQFSPFIDVNYYQRVSNPDLSDLSPRQAFEHLLNEGIEDGRLFSPFVDLNFYKEANPELSDLSNSEALIHLKDIGLEAGLKFYDFVDLEEYRSFNSELSTQSLSDAFVNLATQFAPDDEGRIRYISHAARTSFIDEVDIVTPEMLEGGMDTTITYSKAENTVRMDVEFTGLPYRIDLTRPEDVSTPYNQFPVEILDARWQLWILTNIGSVESNFWYDGQTGDLIGNEFDLFESIPEDNSGLDVNNDGVEDLAVSIPVTQAVSTPIFEGNPDGTASVTFEFDYDQMLDEQGKGGVYISQVPYNINRPDELGLYQTDGGLPVSEAPTWDDALETMRSPFGFSIGHSLEPEVKPDYLASRSSLMIGFTNFYPNLIPDGVIFEPNRGSHRFVEPDDLLTHVNEPSPARLAALEAETEEIFGTANDDVFNAGDINGEFDGNHDSVFAGPGDDLIDATQAVIPGFPSLAGNNSLYGGEGNDTIAGGFQKDRIFGDDGDDVLRGDGNSRLPGGTVGGDDTIEGGNGDDRIGGKAGNDLLLGGEGDDRIWGDDGDDIINGGSGNDTLTGDDFSGGEGADTFVLNIAEGIDTIVDFEVGIDRLDLSGTDATSIDDLVLTQEGANTQISFAGFDLATLQNIEVSDLAIASENHFVFA
ncbi:MAG: calcium-binding protein [Limnoraphis robusta]|uniref:calcium-binding protein n=1 Tax=Limnoraphis robusta TaxID=1118279 RepID=UPI00066D3514|nr:calcium-binding protein [Limnoraphis robusta]